MKPVFIASKGRPSCPTAALLMASGVPHHVVVEPAEVCEYDRQMRGSRIIALDKDNAGLAYVRNEIKRLGGDDWFWMLDDDIKSFSLSIDGKNVRTTAREALEQAEKLFCHLPQVAQAALEYQQFSWSARSDASLIGYCDVAVCIHGARTANLSYRPEMVLKEDRDFTLQVLASGYATLRCSRIGFAAPKNGSNEGGLKELYDTEGRERLAVDRLATAWGPDIVTTQVKADGRYDAKINWRYFRKQMLK